MNNNIFPLPFSLHLIFVILAFALFIVQYVRVRRLYQIIIAVAVSASMLIYAGSSKAWITVVGIIEAVLLAAALVSSIADSRKAKKSAAENSTVQSENESAGEQN
ncbi:hypothetical protein [Porcipelethomonas sp.]|uniref:hypothetical protein n=1 Tax=Porcipelethomonas sp. TaxID=2981675 RepID=UPI003EF551AC